MPFTRRSGLVKIMPDVAKALLRAGSQLRVAPNANAPYLDIVKYINSCKSCRLHETSTCRPAMRGDIPCEVLFIGEANSPRDAIFDSPMSGEAGELVNEWIAALGRDFKGIKCGVTNLVKCVPYLKEVVDGKDHRAVTKGEAQECEKHLIPLIELANPMVVVLMGESAKKWVPRNTVNDAGREYVHVRHPSFILRQYERATIMKDAYNNIFKACEVAGLVF